MLDDEQLALSIGENLTQICHLLEQTKELLIELDSSSGDRVKMNASLDGVLQFIRESCLSEIIDSAPILEKLQYSNIETELQKKVEDVPSRRTPPASFCGFRSKIHATLQRQTFWNIRYLLGHSCAIQTLFSEDSEAEDTLFRMRIGLVLMGPFSHLIKDLFISNPELAVYEWKNEYNWEEEKKFRDNT